MKVLFQMRSDYKTNPAGDTIQMLATGHELKKLGIDVKISTDASIFLDTFDLVHIFNIIRIGESWAFFKNAKTQGKKTVISPIYWNPQKFLNRPEAKPYALKNWNLYQPMRANLLKTCDYIFSSGVSELEHLRADFDLNTPQLIIPNGFPEEYIGIDPTQFYEQFPNIPENFVLCAARISPHKNQDLLAEVCHDLNLPLVLIGPINDQSYFDKVITYSNVHYLGSLSGALLASAFAAAKIHALPSWYEIPGLSSLEAAACGCVIITTDQGSPKDYFADKALYVKPRDKNSLTAALIKAQTWDSEPLSKKVRDSFSWPMVAKKTLEAYNQVI